MHARPANCTSSRESPFQSRPGRIHSRGSAILFLAACRATLILGDRGHKGRRVGRLAGEREEKSPLLSIWIRRRDENTPFVSSNACPFSPPRVLSRPPILPPSFTLQPCRSHPRFQLRSYRWYFLSFLHPSPTSPVPCPDGTRDQNLHPCRVSGIMKGPVETKSIDDAVDPPRLILPEHTGIRSYITRK